MQLNTSVDVTAPPIARGRATAISSRHLLASWLQHYASDMTIFTIICVRYRATRTPNGSTHRFNSAVPADTGAIHRFDVVTFHYTQPSVILLFLLDVLVVSWWTIRARP